MKWTRVVSIAVLQAFVCASLFAANVTKLNKDVFSPLRSPHATQRVTLDIPLSAQATARVEVEEFQVWAPDGKVVIHDGDKVTVQVPPKMRYFRGAVAGDDESFAFFSMDPATGQIAGLVATKNQRYAVSSNRRRVASNPRDAMPGPIEDFIASPDVLDEMAYGSGWDCMVDRAPVRNPLAVIQQATTGLAPQPKAISGTQKHSITIEIETDGELRALAGSDANVTNYVANLTGAASTIYNRDLNTNIVLKAAHVYPNAVSDPWVVTNAFDGLMELGNYYHSASKPAGRTTTAVMMLSGKATFSGIAWVGVIGINDFNQGGFGGPYSWCGSIDPGTALNPDSTQNGVQFGMPLSNYWPLAEFTHELGHNMGGPHTHCVAISGAEATAAGRSFVDVCYSGDGGGCYSGAQSAPPEKGTIMSYCHNLFSSGFPQSRFIFGKSTEVSHHMLDDHLLRAGGPLDGGSNIVACANSVALSAITAPGGVNASTTGNAASVTNAAGQTYEWTITGGTITAGAATNSVTFSAGASGNVVLRVSTYNSARCGVTDTRTVPISSGPPARGNVNGAGGIDGVDAIYLANFLFAAGPNPIGSADVDADTFVSIKDLFYLVNFVFGGGAAPAP